MAACLPFFDSGTCALAGNYPGGVGNDFAGTCAGLYHNNGYDGAGGCTGSFAVSDAGGVLAFIGAPGAWNATTKQGTVAALGIPGVVTGLTIDNTIIKSLGPDSLRGGLPVVVQIRLTTGIFVTNTGGFGTLSIGCKTSLGIQPISLANGQLGVTYPPNQTFIGAGGTAPYTFTLNSGSLPPGLSLSAGGTISGTPTSTGVYTFTVSCVDVAGTACPGVSGTYAIAIPDTATSGDTTSLSPGTDSGGGSGCTPGVGPGADTGGGAGCTDTL